MLDAIENRSLRSAVAARIFDAIIRGELRPGERIVQGRFALQLGVAKTSLREALQELEHQGIITKVERRGTFVTKLTTSDINERYDLRLQLEPYAAGLAHERMSDEGFSRLSDLFEQMRNAAKRNDFLDFSTTDADLHQLIWRGSANSFLQRVLKLICLPLWAFELIYLHAAPTYDFSKVIDEHSVLLDVLKRGGPEEVKRTFYDMLQVFRQQDIRNLQALEGEAKLGLKKSTPKGASLAVWESFRGVGSPEA